MKALYYVGDNHMEMREIPVPVPKSDECLLKVDACGICGSDFEGFLGKTGRRIAPMIMGHEFAGTIVKKAENGKYPEGTRAAVFPKLFCGECEVCRKGLVNLCPHAKFLGVLDCDGAMTEYLCVQERYLIPYEGIGADIAAMTEPAAVAYNGVSKISDKELSTADHILVVGAGTIGMLVTLWLKYRGAKHVIVSDTFDSRLQLAKKMGADDVLNPTKCDFMEKITELTNGAMCDLSVEAVGVSPTAQSSIDALKMSGTAIWIGNAAKMVSINMQKVVTTELKIKGNYIYSWDDFAWCLKLLAQGAIDVKPMITNYYDMAQGVEAFELLKNNKDGSAIKVMLLNR